MLAALEKSEFGLYSVIGVMTVIVMLAYTMRSVRGRIAAVEDDMRQTYTVTYTEGSDPFELRMEFDTRRQCPKISHEIYSC